MKNYNFTTCVYHMTCRWLRGQNASLNIMEHRFNYQKDWEFIFWRRKKKSQSAHCMVSAMIIKGGAYSLQNVASYISFYWLFIIFLSTDVFSSFPQFSEQVKHHAYHYRNLQEASNLHSDSKSPVCGLNLLPQNMRTLKPSSLFIKAMT